MDTIERSAPARVSRRSGCAGDVRGHRLAGAPRWEARQDSRQPTSPRHVVSSGHCRETAARPGARTMPGWLEDRSPISPRRSGPRLLRSARPKVHCGGAAALVECGRPTQIDWEVSEDGHPTREEVAAHRGTRTHVDHITLSTRVGEMIGGCASPCARRAAAPQRTARFSPWRCGTRSPARPDPPARQPPLSCLLHWSARCRFFRYERPSRSGGVATIGRRQTYVRAGGRLRQTVLVVSTSSKAAPSRPRNRLPGPKRVPVR